MTAVRFALRLGRWGIAGFGLLAFASSLIVTLAFYNVAGHTQAERAAFGRSITILASQFTVILPPPIRPDTAPGFVQFRSYGGLAILFAVWALASAIGATRGDEERGVVEVVLAATVLRVAMLASSIAAYASCARATDANAAAGAGAPRSARRHSDDKIQMPPAPGLQPGETQVLQPKQKELLPPPQSCT